MAKIQTVFICSFVLLSRKQERRHRKRVMEEEGGPIRSETAPFVFAADDQLCTGRVNGSLVGVEEKRVRTGRAAKKMGIKRHPAGGRSVGLCACHL